MESEKKIYLLVPHEKKDELKQLYNIKWDAKTKLWFIGEMVEGLKPSAIIMNLLELNNDVLCMIGNYIKKDNEKRVKDDRFIEMLVNQYRLQFEDLLKEYRYFKGPVDINLEITKILVD
jgi:hypothetical protein